MVDPYLGQVYQLKEVSRFSFSWSLPPTFPQVHSLENVCGVHAIRLCGLEKLRDLLHLLKGHLSF